MPRQAFQQRSYDVLNSPFTFVPSTGLQTVLYNLNIDPTHNKYNEIYQNVKNGHYGIFITITDELVKTIYSNHDLLNALENISWVLVIYNPSTGRYNDEIDRKIYKRMQDVVQDALHLHKQYKSYDQYKSGEHTLVEDFVLPSEKHTSSTTNRVVNRGHKICT